MKNAARKKLTRATGAFLALLLAITPLSVCAAADSGEDPAGSSAVVTDTTADVNSNEANPDAVAGSDEANPDASTGSEEANSDASTGSEEANSDASAGSGEANSDASAGSGETNPDASVSEQAGTAAEWPKTWTSGDVTVTLDEEGTMTLTKDPAIEGNGVTADYASGDQPWYGDDMKKITKLVVDKSVTVLGDRLFLGSKLVNVTLPDSVISIGEGTFRQITTLESVTLPDSVKVLKRVAFYGCTALTEAVLKGTYTSLQDQLFSGCTSLKTVTIPATVTELELTSKGACSVFANCAITAVTYGGTEEAWAKLVAADSKGTLANAAVTYEGIVPPTTEEPEEPPAPVYSGKTGEVNWSYDPETKTLTFSGNGATADYKKANAEDADWGIYIPEIEKLVVEEGVTGIGSRVVYGAVKLTDVSLPNSLLSIGEGAFRACTGLESITIPDNVETLSRVAFYGCSGLTEAILGGTYTSLTDQLFNNCSKLAKVTIPATVTELELTSKGACSVFANCAITEVIYGGTEEAWAKLVEADKNGTLSSADVTCLGIVPEKPETSYSGKTGEADWSYDPETRTLTISGTGATADYKADAQDAPWKPFLQEIETLAVEAGVTKLGKYLVSGSDSLIDIQLPNTLTTIEYSAFRECNSLTTATVPDSVTNLVRCAFYFNPALETVVLGGTYTTLTDKQFQKCGALREVTLPGTIELIEANAFGSCNSLSIIHYGNTIAKWQEVLSKGEGATALCKDSITVHCTDGDYVYGRVSLGNLYYVIEDGALIIGGEGDIPDFADQAEAPWAADAGKITKVVLKQGVNKIGANAFGSLTALKETCYVGTQEAWSALQAAAGSGNEPLFEAPFASGVEGSCGARASWTFNPDSGLLTIRGSGAMTDYTTRRETPWYYSLEDIRQLVIEEGITKAGDYAFHNCKNLARVTLPGTLELLGTYCLGGCSSLTEIRIPEGTRVIGAKAFSASIGLTSVSLPESLEYIDMKAFDSDVKITNVTYNGTAKQWEKVIVSCNANGNDNLLVPKGKFTCLKEIPDAADVYSDLADWYKDAVQYLLENEFLPEESTFHGEEPAELDMVLEALYRKAGSPGMYADAGQWALDYGIVDDSRNVPLTDKDMALVLYRAALYNMGQKIETVSAEDAIEWVESQGYFMPSAAPDQTMPRSTAAVVLSYYLQSQSGTADRYDALLNQFKQAKAQNGDGKMYILTVDVANRQKLGIKPGDCAVVLFPDGKVMMIDSGVAAAESSVLKVVRDLELNSLDYLVLSHPHSDHAGNALAVAKYIYEERQGTIANYYSSAFHYGTAESGLIAYLEEKGAAMHMDTNTGDQLTIGDVTIDFYNPSAAFVETTINGGSTADETVNNVSLLMKFTYGNSTYLTGGDLYRSQELQLLSAFGSQLQADVVKTNHHGCYTSNSPEWVGTVDPLILLTHSDDIGDANIAMRTTRDGVAFFSAGLDGNILVSMDDQANYVVYHQYDNILRKDYHGSVEIGEKAEKVPQPDNPPDNTDDADDADTDDSSDDDLGSSGGSGSQSTGGQGTGSQGTGGSGVQPKPGTGTEPTWSNPFDDVNKEEWYYDAVKYVSENSLMSGVENGEFAPDEELSRAMLAQILYSKEGKPGVSRNDRMTDVAGNAWYANAVAWAMEQGFVSGYGDGRFGPDDAITREQLAMMLWRYAESPETSSQTLSFRDVGEISGYALKAVAWAVEKGVISGRENNILSPDGRATRAEAATMLMRYFESIGN